MADELISDEQLAAMAASPLRAMNDGGSVEMQSLKDILALLEFKERRRIGRRGPFGGASIQLPVMPGAVPCVE